MKRGLWLALLAALLSAGWANADVWTGGGPECLPAVADYDGDGKADLALFRPANASWYIIGSTTGILVRPFGESPDLPTQGAFIY
mgnify:CR=1 FL=1